MKKDTTMIMGVVFFILFLTVLIIVIIGSNMLPSNPIQSFLLLSGYLIIGAFVLARHFDRTSRKILSEGHSFQPGISGLPRVVTFSKPRSAKRAHPRVNIYDFINDNRVRFRIGRWKKERRSVVEEPLQKALQKSRSRTCPKCGSRAADICACRYRSKFL